MKIAVVTDSNSCITPEEAKKLGVYVIPMPFMIDDEEYFEGINLTHEQFYEKLENDADVVTSQPVPQVVTDLWDEILTEYDQIIHIPMSSGLSGACQTAMMLAEDYDDKIFVVNNQRICPTQLYSVYDALKMIEKGYDGAKIKEILEKRRFDTTIYITVGTLKYLKKGGRITPAVATIGNLLKIKPILAIHGEKLDAFATTRTLSSSKAIMINALKNDMEKLIHCTDYSKYRISVAYSAPIDIVEEFRQDLEKEFGVHVDCMPLSLSVSCHIGPVSLACAISKIVED